MNRRIPGFALAVVIIMLTLLFTLGFAYTLRTGSHLFTTTHLISETKASYLADSGVRFMLPNVFALNVPFTQVLTFSTGTVTVTARQSGINRIISSVGLSGSVSHTIVVQVNPDGGVASWSESSE